MLKRIFDFCAALLLLIMLLPVVIVVFLVVWVTMGWPVFFVQARPGYQSRPFKLIKFRTMRNAALVGGVPTESDSARLGKLGALLRKFSLDEIPQLLNILRGDMSLVGPRPLLMRYLDRYSPEQARRHNVRPGVTGWAQVNGRNTISWAKKFELDLWYVDNQSFGLDMRILWMTLLRVLLGSGVSQQGHATVEEFMGNDTE